MLLDLYASTRESLIALIGLITSSIIIEALLVVAVPWVAWRLYQFTIKPLLHPQSPKELPYWTPVLGHALSFVKDAQSLVNYGKKYFGYSKEPFTIIAGGEKLYILTSAQDIGAVYRNNVTLSWDAMLNDLLVGFGINPKAIHLIWEKLPQTILARARPEMAMDKIPHHSAVHSTLDLYKRQLLPGPKYDIFNQTLTDYISAALSLDHLAPQRLLQEKSSIKQIPLSQVCNDVLIGAVTKTLYGKHIYDIEPEMTQCLLDFNYDAWMLVFKYPHGPKSKLSIARKKILAAFTKYVQTPEHLLEDRSYLLDNVLYEQKAAGIPEEDRAGMLLMIYWAANINPYRTAFWMMSYILHDESLRTNLVDELSQVYHNNELDVPRLLTDCPRLESVYNETLRVVVGALSARKIIAPTIIGGKVLEPGNTIIIPFQQLHYNKEVFGEDPSHFDPERFLNKPSLANSSSFKPFGGGVNYCPGRFLAKQEMMVFVALMLVKLDARLASNLNQSFPEMDTSTPALGINGAKLGQDVLIDLQML